MLELELAQGGQYLEGLIQGLVSCSELSGLVKGNARAFVPFLAVLSYSIQI